MILLLGYFFNFFQRRSEQNFSRKYFQGVPDKKSKNSASEKNRFLRKSVQGLSLQDLKISRKITTNKLLRPPEKANFQECIARAIFKTFYEFIKNFFHGPPRQK